MQKQTADISRATFLLASLPIIPGIGNIFQVAHEASGWIRFALTTISHPLICRDTPCIEVIPGWCNSPSQLCYNDDDDVCLCCFRCTLDAHWWWWSWWHHICWSCLLSAVCVGVATEWIPGGTGAILPVGSARWYHPASGGDRRSDVRLHVLCAALRWPALPHSRGTAAERHRRGKAVWADCVGGGTLSWVGRRSAWSETAQVRLQGPTEVSFLDFYVCFIIRSVSLWLWSRLHIIITPVYTEVNCDAVLFV